MNKKFKFLISILLVMMLCAGAAFFAEQVKAASVPTLYVDEINYSDSTITFYSVAGDSCVYISSNGKSGWEQYPVVFAAGRATMDISWIPLGNNYKLYFKGNESTTVGYVVIPKQASNFKVKYIPNQTYPFSFVNNGDRTVEWRKDGESTWKVWNMSTTNDSLGYLKGNGTTLYFRLAPENGAKNGARDFSGYRASKEVSVKITAKKAAPTISVNASAFSIPLSSKMSYRMVKIDKDGKVSTNDIAWKSIASSKDYPLSTLVPEVMYSGTDVQETCDMAIQFKNNATSSSQESRITTIIIPAQRKAPTESSAGASISFTSSSNLELTILAANTTTPYEYCVVEKDDYKADGPVYEDMSWSTVSSSSPVSISKSKAPMGSHIYIRLKSINNLGDDNYEIASDSFDITGAAGVVYPDAITAGKVTDIVVPAGTINKGDYGKNATFTITAYSKTTVSSLEFKNSFGTTLGNVEVTSSVSKNSKSKNKDEAYLITTKIVSTSQLELEPSALDTKLYGIINLANGEKIVSTDDTGVTLFMYSKSSVSVPESSEKSNFGKYYDLYSKDFNRIYLSNESNDKTCFKFIVDFGSRYVMSNSNAGSSTENKLKLSEITFDAYKLSFKEAEADNDFDAKEEEAYASAKTDAYVIYEDYINNDGAEGRRAYVTIHADRFEANPSIKEIGKKLPIVLKLNNGEALANSVFMTLQMTASIDDAPIAWTVTEGSLIESSTVKNYDSNGNVTSSESQPINTYGLELTKNSADYSVGISDVTWNGISVLHDAMVAGNKIQIILSNAKINTLSAGSSGSMTKNIEISFSNGYKITTGCKLTVLKKAK